MILIELLLTSLLQLRIPLHVLTLPDVDSLPHLATVTLIFDLVHQEHIRKVLLRVVQIIDFDVKLLNQRCARQVNFDFNSQFYQIR